MQERKNASTLEDFFAAQGNNFRSDLSSSLARYLDEKKETAQDLFFLQYIHQQLNSDNPQSLARPFDFDKNNPLAEERKKRAGEDATRLRKLSNTFLADSSTLRTIQQDIQNLPSLQSLQKTLNDYFEWDGANNNPPLTNIQKDEVRHHLIAGYAFQVANAAIKKPDQPPVANGPAINPEEIAKNEILKNIALNVDSNDIYEDVKASLLSEKHFHDLTSLYMRMKENLNKNKTEDEIPLLKNEISSALARINDNRLSPYLTDDMKTTLAANLRESVNKGLSERNPQLRDKEKQEVLRHLDRELIDFLHKGKFYDKSDSFKTLKDEFTKIQSQLNKHPKNKSLQNRYAAINQLLNNFDKVNTQGINNAIERASGKKSNEATHQSKHRFIGGFFKRFTKKEENSTVSALKNFREGLADLRHTLAQEETQTPAKNPAIRGQITSQPPSDFTDKKEQGARRKHAVPTRPLPAPPPKKNGP